MKILFFIESLRAGGKERRIIELIKGLKNLNDIQVELVLTRDEIHYPEIFQLAIPIHIIKRKFFKKDPLVFFKFFFLVKKIRPDIIHVWGHMVAVYAVPTKWILKLPLINNEITDATPNKKLIAKSIVFRASDRIISNTKVGLVAYQAPAFKSGVIYNGFNFQRIAKMQDPSSVREQFGIRTTYVVGMVASFIEYKDWDTYLKAAMLITEKRENVTFLCVGDGDDSAYRKMVASGRSERILFLGKQSQIEPIMNICSIGVLMTNIKNHGEGISNALMEFMALGKPVIATNFGGSIELIENSVCGYLIDPYSFTQLAASIEYILDNSNERNRLGMEAQARIKKNFSIESMVSNFYLEYVSLSRDGS